MYDEARATQIWRVFSDAHCSLITTLFIYTMQSAVIATVILSVRPSVRLSHAGIVPGRMKIN